MKKILAMILALALMLLTAAAFAEEEPAPNTSTSAPVMLDINSNVQLDTASYNANYSGSGEGFQISWNVTAAAGHNSNNYHWDAGQQTFVAEAAVTTWTTDPAISVIVKNFGTKALYVSNSFSGTGVFSGVTAVGTLWNNRQVAGFDAAAYFEVYANEWTGVESTVPESAFDGADGSYTFSTLPTSGVTAGDLTIGTFTVSAHY